MGGLRVVELFAGVGGFHLGLAKAGHEIVWSNQWEPGKKAQWASDCYRRQFPHTAHSNEDIATVDSKSIPDHDILVGGFPCQDYSVAATLDKSHGIQGKKGVLWWQISRIVRAKKPRYLLLENVDRLLKSPARQRGRDFAIVLSNLANYGYAVEWRVVNAADYGFPQKRRRVFIFAAHESTPEGKAMAKGAARWKWLATDGFFARTFPTRSDAVMLDDEKPCDRKLDHRLSILSEKFSFEFQNAGIMVDHEVWTRKVQPGGKDPVVTLASVLQDDAPKECIIPKEKLEGWKHLKGAKRLMRRAKNGHVYEYSEGAIPYPDHVDQPSRTLLTGEGGTNPSRSNHIIKDPATNKLRCLTPLECERLNGFPDGWTEGMPDRWRYFTMGNALVVGLIERMANQLPGRVKVSENSPIPRTR